MCTKGSLLCKKILKSTKIRIKIEFCKRNYTICAQKVVKVFLELFYSLFNLTLVNRVKFILTAP